ncbi:hypothetical protein SAMN05443287_102449 [Micromonospora phaseoli]|uniref:Beta-galactosidase n=1 Tax=Micromonospora phaseoli TaxID=1144548 RepID=A0A1H6UY01_9ACTN|nr:hypothetical protein [Micromonospora phaseoli]PZV93797.1 hypothetical protein CLV64_109258 [Micromonospora phaseoli]GIJ79927.1 hypothetical protein Xph01_43590 [Micromonospora phaseoli]SEI97259.1 hypothetical protein SAMN05443287_102449 [Micromonospora phaseoli]
MRALAVLATMVMAAAVVGVPAQASVTLKEPLRGLIDRAGPASGAYAPVVDGFVIRVNWSDLQPQQQAGTDHGGDLDTTAIDDALAAATTAGMSTRLRVVGGIHAPDWAKTLGGGDPIPWYAEGVQVGTIGPFWTAAYGTAYQNLQDRLAAMYDDEPRLLDVVISRCTTEFAEPYIRQTGQLSLNRPGLEAAGYTGAADDQCHRDEIDAHDVWERTRSYLAFNPYQRIDEVSWTGSVDMPFTRAMIDYCRASLGERCVLGNNSIYPDRPNNYFTMYAYIAAKGGPISYQTATADKVCFDQSPCPASVWNQTMDLALTYGASAVELPRGVTGYPSWSLADVPPDHGLQHYDSLLEATAVAGRRASDG